MIFCSFILILKNQVYKIKDYVGALEENTNYVAKYYATVGSITYYSDYLYFTTASSTVSFVSGGISDISETNAIISTWANSTGTITELGFYIGLSDEYQNKIAVTTVPVGWTDFHLVYNIKDYYNDLAPGQTYTYLFYAKKGQKEYHSSVCHFTTKGTADITYDTYSYKNITANDAEVGAWFSNNTAKTISSLGFLYGEKISDL